MDYSDFGDGGRGYEMGQLLGRSLMLCVSRMHQRPCFYLLLVLLAFGWACDFVLSVVTKVYIEGYGLEDW